MALAGRQGYQGYQGYGTPGRKSRERERAVLDSLLALASKPSNSLGTGMTQIANALAYRYRSKRADKREAAGNEKYTENLAAARKMGPDDPGYAAVLAALAGSDSGSESQRARVKSMQEATYPLTRAQLQTQENWTSMFAQRASQFKTTSGIARGNLGVAQGNAARAAAKRETIRGQDGFMYYLDTQKRVLPGIEAAPDAPTPITPLQVQAQENADRQYKLAVRKFEASRTDAERNAALAEIAAADALKRDARDASLARDKFGETQAQNESRGNRADIGVGIDLERLDLANEQFKAQGTRADRTFERGVVTSDRDYGLKQNRLGLAQTAATRAAAPPEITAYQQAQMELRQKLQDERIAAGVDIPINPGDILASQQPSPDSVSETAPPPEPDVAPAYGIEGVAKGAINWGLDFVGWGLAWPKADIAKRAVTSLNVETVMGFKSLVNQRLSNQMITAFEELTAKSGTGKEGALTQFKQTRALLQRALENNRKVTASPENFTAKAVSDAGQDGIALQGLLDRYNSIIENFDSGINAPQTTGDSDADKIMDQLRREGLIQ